MNEKDVERYHAYMKECAAEAARVARAVAAAGPDRLGDPTPCAAFDLRTLVNHWVLYTSHGLEHRARREPLPEELTGRDFTAGGSWAEEYAAQLDRAVAAWADPAVWEGDVDFGGGSAPAVDVASMVIKEMAVHGWDAARSVGAELRVSPEAGAFVLGVVEEHGDIYRKYDGFADPVPVPADAPAFERALGASGRDPNWRAGGGV
ncbi:MULTISPECIES: TIGR03086 family metal-binding protein [Actinomadura]|uniref:TIGR03086 family metal-binding protein n=1 Tax=Actinomadura TaxID=1988 RepID=UPI00042477B6|nr:MULTISPECIES: TIGR03086 family metal-binding protein [Actinomadura]RSN62280.1 TIGR03086 family protein [Actinomadura sp. WAC 06369]